MAPRKTISKFTYIMAFLILLVAIFAAASLVIGNPFQALSSTENASQNNNYCLEKECIRESETLLYNMKRTADPCDDFYEFACGNYANENPLKSDENEINDMIKLDDAISLRLRIILEEPPEKDEPAFFKKLKILYKDCNDEETINKRGLAPIKEILDSIGGWPVVNDTEPENDWETVLYALRENDFQSHIIMAHSITTEFENSTKRIIQISPPSHLLFQETMAKGKSDKSVQFYLKYLTSIAKWFGAKPEVAARDMEDAVDFQILLAKASKSRETLRQNLKESNNIYTIEKLERDFPKFPWMKYMDSLTPKNFTVTRDLRLQVTEPEYIKKLIEYLENTPNRTIINYFIVNQISEKLGNLDVTSRKIHLQLATDIEGRETEQERYKQCTNYVKNALGILVSSLYIRNFFDTETKAKATEMFDYLIESFKKSLEESNWTELDKKKAYEKIGNLSRVVGFPDEIMDMGKLGEIYDKLEIVEGDFFKSNLLIEKFSEEFFYNRLYLPVNKTDWVDYSNVAAVNAYYAPDRNIIVINAPILQGGIFNAKRPNYLNFATLGSVIAHEISHGFDEKGRQYDVDGELRNWLSKQAIDDFAVKKKCIVDQYDKYTIYDGTHVKGGATASENLADFGGQKVAYNAYQNWMKEKGAERSLPGLNYTVQQIYWISAASFHCSNIKDKTLSHSITSDAHAPKRFRVNGPLSNLKEFARDFNCSVGTNMNPEQKCQPW